MRNSSIPESKELAKTFVESVTINTVKEVNTTFKHNLFKVLCDFESHPIKITHSIYVEFSGDSAFLTILGFGIVHRVDKQHLRHLKEDYEAGQQKESK